ncbi:MAG: hypothetical protein Q8R18_06780 [bacterium]|nr:hypothetical protein [bacterium]
MSLTEYITTEEELDVFRRNPNNEGFILHLPIPPVLLKKNISLSRDLAPEVFPEALKEWKRRLGKVQLAEGEETKLAQRYIFTETACLRDGYKIDAHPIPGGNVTWFTTETGFAHAFSIGRNSGGSLYFNNMSSPIGVYKHTVHFSQEKMRLYRIEDDDQHPQLFCYELHNVDSYISALLLLSWGRQYINAALEDLIKTS